MTRIYIKLLMTAIFWGGTFVAGRVIAGHVNPVAAAFLRFVVASAFLVALSLKSKSKSHPMNGQKILALFLLGATGVFAYNLFLFINFVPLSAIIMGFLLLDEPMTLSLAIGALLVITGVVLTNSESVRVLKKTVA